MWDLLLTVIVIAGVSWLIDRAACDWRPSALQPKPAEPEDSQPSANQPPTLRSDWLRLERQPKHGGGN